jgi:hypothetical protein
MASEILINQTTIDDLLNLIALAAWECGESVLQEDEEIETHILTLDTTKIEYATIQLKIYTLEEQSLVEIHSNVIKDK